MSESDDSTISKSEYDSSDSVKNDSQPAQIVNSSVTDNEAEKQSKNSLKKLDNSSQEINKKEQENSDSDNSSDNIKDDIDERPSGSQNIDKSKGKNQVNDSDKNPKTQIEKKEKKISSSREEKTKKEKKESNESKAKKVEKVAKTTDKAELIKDGKNSNTKNSKEKNDDNLDKEKNNENKKVKSSDVDEKQDKKKKEKKKSDEEMPKSKKSTDKNTSKLKSSDEKKPNSNKSDSAENDLTTPKNIKANEDKKSSEVLNFEEIPKMSEILIDNDDQKNGNLSNKRRKSTVTFNLPPIANKDHDGDNIAIKAKSKSNNDIVPPKKGSQNVDEISDPINQIKKNELVKHTRASSNPARPSIDPRSVPRRFSKMTIAQIDEVIKKEDKLLDAITFFNQTKDPSKLCEYYELEETPDNISQIFWGTKDINSVTLGKFLLKRKEMLDAYFNFVEMNEGPIQSLRNALLGPMRFDGESQTVHKVLSSISRCYAQKNPDKCQDPDNMLDLYYALIMLNTDLSNPNNKTKMSLQEFIKNTKGANQYLSTLTDEELTDYYKDISKNPLLFQNQSDDFTYEFCPKIRGYLKKKSLHTFGTWTKKYFVLINTCLYYFADDNPENAKFPIGAIYLKGVEPFRNIDTKPLLIRITAKKKEVKYAKFINRQKESPKYVRGIKEILLEAPDRASSSKWFHRIRVAAQVSNFIKEKKEDIVEENNVYETDIPDAADDSVEEIDQ